MSHKTYLRLYENAPPEKQSRADASGENVGYGNRINSSVASNVCGLSFRVIRTIQKMIVLMLAQHCKYIYKAPNVYFPWVHFTVCDLCPNIKILQGETVGMLVELSLGMYISHDRAPRVPILATPLQVLAEFFNWVLATHKGEPDHVPNFCLDQLQLLQTSGNKPADGKYISSTFSPCLSKKTEMLPMLYKRQMLEELKHKYTVKL